MYKRKWGSTFAGSYAKQMGLRPIPFKRRRPNVPFKKGPAIPRSAPRLPGRSRLALKGRTPTSTRTRQKKRFGNVVKHSDNSSMSSSRFGYACPRRIRMLFKNMLGRRTVRTVNATNFSTNGGQQNQHTDTVLDRTELLSAKLEITGTSSNNNFKFFLGYMKYRMVVKNQVNHVVRVTFYDIVPKFTQVSSLDTPQECWIKGQQDLGLAATDNRVPHATPFSSPEFRRFMRVVKTTTVYLEPGQQHEHSVYRRINRLINSTEFDNANSNAVRGCTYFCMINVLGSLGHEAATPTTVSYMPCTLDIVSHREYYYSYLPGSTPTYTAVNNLSAVTTWNFMGEQGDIDANMVTS